MPRPRRRRLRLDRIVYEDLVCCAALGSFAFTGEDRLIHYSPELREFGIAYGMLLGGGFQQLAFCPWCGARLPFGLRGLYFELVREAMGEDWHPLLPVPRAFRSDAWWRERGIAFDVGEDPSQVWRALALQRTGGANEEDGQVGQRQARLARHDKVVSYCTPCLSRGA